MSVEIGEMHTNVTVVDGELPLNERQLEKLIGIICTRLKSEQREAQRGNESTTLTRSAAPPAHVGE